MTLVVLGLVWLFVITRFLLRKRAQRRADASIGSFHRQLSVLARTGRRCVDPVDMAPRTVRAFPVAIDRSVEAQPAAAMPAVAGTPLGRIDVSARRVDAGTGRAGTGRAGTGRADTTRRRGTRPDPFFRPEACRRRLAVVKVLLVLAAGSAVVAVVPEARMIGVVAAAAALTVLAVYLAVLVRMRNLAVEREVKLRYLPTVAQPEPAFVVRRLATR